MDNIIGQGLFEVGTIAASGGAAALAKAAKAMENLDDLGDGARALENTEDALDVVDDLGPVPRKLGEVVHKVEPPKRKKPDWLQRLNEGNKFNKERAEFYDYNEVYLKKADGSGYNRLDSYNPGQDIVSRKHTQLSEIQESTAKRYIDEINQKYPEGAEIADVPSNIDGANSGIFDGGNILEGEKILEIPVQNNPVPKSVIDAANKADITIRDVNGTIINQ